MPGPNRSRSSPVLVRWCLGSCRCRSQTRERRTHGRYDGTELPPRSTMAGDSVRPFAHNHDKHLYSPRSRRRTARSLTNFPPSNTGGAPLPSVSHRRLHTRGAEALPRIPLIVSSTTQPQILSRALAAERPGLDVVEFEPPTRPAPPPIRRDIAALLAVSQHYRPRNRRRHRTAPLPVRARVSL